MGRMRIAQLANFVGPTSGGMKVVVEQLGQGYVDAGHTRNPLTVLKGYQQLVGEGVVEKRRGRGMFVTPGARVSLMRDEREKFLAMEWPRVLSTIERLGLDAGDLLKK